MFKYRKRSTGKMSMEDEVHHELNRLITRINNWISLGVICFIFILQIIVRRSTKEENQQMNRYTNHSIFYSTLMCLYLVHGGQQLFNVAMDYGWPSCTACEYMHLTGSLIFVVTRVVTFAFILQRAKMAQGITPVVGPKWFSHYFPTAIFMIWISFTVVLVINKDYVEVKCPTFGRSAYCEARYVSHWRNIAAFTLAGLTEAFVSSVLLFLFVWPIWKIKQSGISIAISQQNCGDRLLMSTLKWNIAMSSMSLFTSLITIVGLTLIDGRFEYALGPDRAFNALTAFLMLGRNRDFLRMNSTVLLKGIKKAKTHISLADIGLRSISEIQMDISNESQLQRADSADEKNQNAPESPRS